MYTPRMEAPNFEFNMSRLERVIAGPGKVSELGAELELRGLQRAIIVTGKTLGSSPLLDKVTSAIGARCVGVFRGAKQHVPWSSVHRLRAEIERLDADSLISFGGGSPIDTCKVASHAFLTSRELVHIAVPTTLSAGEYTHAGGVTDETTLVKSGVSDPRLQARTIFNDPDLTLETPTWLWVATGMRSLDHAIESIYAIRHHLLSDTLASKAIFLLREHLPGSINADREDQIAHRGYCQMAAWFSIFGAMNTRFSISHLLGHQIGPRWNVPHGITSCITLPHAMRFMADVAPDRFGPIAAGFDLPFEPTKAKAAALACAEAAAKFIAQFDVPHTLKDAGVPRDELHEIVGPIAHELERSGTIDRPVTEREIQSLLEAAY
ncbi:MAG: iron-containing alcohol dehydrogenase [Candidatus Acidiferrales bacterium]